MSHWDYIRTTGDICGPVGNSIENKIGKPASNSNWENLCLLCTDDFEKGMNPSITLHPLPMGEITGQTWLSNFGWPIQNQKVKQAMLSHYLKKNLVSETRSSSWSWPHATQTICWNEQINNMGMTIIFLAWNCLKLDSLL